MLWLSILYGGFNAVFYVWLSQGSFFETYLKWNAKLTAMFLNAVGDDATVDGVNVVSPRWSLEIRSGCDGIQASAFFVFAVLTSPVSVSLRARAAPMLVGTLILLLLNLVRIISLYYTGVYSPSLFELMHVDVWQAVFVFLPLTFWVVWVRRAMQRGRVTRDVAA